MTAKDETCEVCGHTEFFAGVASSRLAPMSCALCYLCINMRAEMRIILESTVKSCGGIEHISENVGLIYFDQEKDSYIDYRSKEVIPMRLKDGKEFLTRNEFIDYERK